MDKTDRQMLLEALHGKAIDDVLRSALTERKGQRNALTSIAADLQVTTATLYRWFRDCGIDIDEYKADRAPVQGEAK